MGHCHVREADAILDKEYSVLDRGFIRLVDYLGSDERIVDAARVSYGEGTRTFRQNAGLIDHLLRNGHTSPFEQVNFTFHARMPIFVARQWVRHRTARLNEISGRYSVMNDDFFLPELKDIAQQSTDNKQGRQNEPMAPEDAENVQKSIQAAHETAYREYENLLKKGVARELARIVLPLSLYTEWYWQIDLHNLFHFLKLRMDPHAQLEIRAYANVMKEIASTVCPLAFQSFDRHVMGGIHFSDAEFEALTQMLDGKPHNLSGREAERFETKLREGRQV